MTKIPPDHDRTEEQLSLPFEVNKTSQYTEGSFKRADSIQKAIHDTLKRCLLSREQIADEMSRLLSESITTNHIANWSAESKKGYRIPLGWAPAFSAATNDTAVIKAAFQGTGLTILDDTEVVFYEIGKAIEEKRERDAELKKSRDRLKTLRMQRKL